MALDFPASPTTGQHFNDWVYDGTAWRFAQTAPGGLPAGAIMPWAGSAAPHNWLLCDGSAVSRTTYSTLFSVVGTSYGAGDGSTTFNLPDLRGRIPVGKSGSGTFGTLGSAGGAETVTLTEAQMPSHTHIQNAHTHTQNAHNHQFTYGGSNYNSWAAGTGFGSFINMLVGNSGVGTQTGISSVTATNQNTTATNQNTGGGQAHNNLQPYQVVNYIIKASAAITPDESQLTPRVTALEADVDSIESVNASQTSRLSTLEGYNAGTRLSNLEGQAPGTAGQPFRMAAGTISTGTYAGTASGWYYYSNKTITLPSGRFSVAPVINASPQINGVSTCQVSSTSGTSSFAVGYAVLGGQVSGFFHWQAVQMTSSAAAG